MSSDDRLFKGRRGVAARRPASEPQASTSQAPVGLSALQKLRLIWKGLSEEEKRAFLQETSPIYLQQGLVDQGFSAPAAAAPAPETPAPAAPEPAALPEAAAASSAAQPAGAALLDPSNRRDAERRAVEMPARIVYDNDTSTLDAKVVDISDTGARMTLQNTLQVPKYFRVQLDSGRAPLVAEVVWRKLNEIGVRLRR